MSGARETAPRALWGTDEFLDRAGRAVAGRGCVFGVTAVPVRW